MTKWRIVSGSRDFYKFEDREISIGWARELQKDDEVRTLNVCVEQSAADAADLPDECRAAIRSHGRSAVNAVLDDDKLPWVIDVTTSGLVPEYRDDVPEEDEEPSSEPEQQTPAPEET